MCAATPATVDSRSRSHLQRPVLAHRQARTVAVSLAETSGDEPSEPPHSGLARRPSGRRDRAAGDPSRLDGQARLTPGNMGDHLAVHQLLSAVFQGPSRDAFLASLDDPFYEPCDRLIVRRGLRLVSHLQLVPRSMNIGGLLCPVAGLSSLGTLPEFRHLGYAQALVVAAERALLAEGSKLGLLSTKIPHFFRPYGWAVCGRHSHARAGTRALLSQLSARGVSAEDAELNIRPWRQVELPALMRLYAQNTAGSHGAFERTEAYWRWLITRQGFDQIWVALAGDDRFNLDLVDAAIVGYAVTKEDRILELMTVPGAPRVGEQLLSRACGEAIERDYHGIQLHAPPNCPLYDLFRISGGTVCEHESHQGEVQMVKLVDPIGFWRFLAPELQRRLQENLGQRSCELGLHVENEKFQLIVSRRGLKVDRSKLGRSYLRLNRAELTRLVMGHLDLEACIEQGRLFASTRLALQTAGALFPRLPFWRSPWDDLFI
jgi:GNAT superfamily N-acetyltransferase